MASSDPPPTAPSVEASALSTMFVPDPEVVEMVIATLAGAEKPQKSSNDASSRESALFPRSVHRFFFSKAVVESEFVRFNFQYFCNLDRIAMACAGIVAIFPQVFAVSIVLRAFWAADTFFSLLFIGLDILVVAQYKKRQRDPSFVHEMLFWTALLIVSILLGAGCPRTEDECQRANVSFHSTTPQQRWETCVNAVYPYPFAVLAIALVCGRPRVMWMVACAITGIVTKNLSRLVFSVDSGKVAVMKVVADVLLSAVLLGCHAALEQSHRTAFEEYVKAYARMEQAAKQKEATDAYLSQLMPPMLYSRVLSRERYEDSGSSVSVFVASVTDLFEWVPITADRTALTEAVSRVSAFMAFCDYSLKRVQVERIRVTGDEFIATSNLIVQTLSHAMRITVFAATVLAYLNRFPLPVRCAVHTGALRGRVTGARFLRYDVSGEGIDVARHLLNCCRDGEIAVSSVTQQLLRDRATLVPCDAVLPFVGKSGEPMGVFLLRGMKSSRVKPPQQPANEPGTDPHCPDESGVATPTDSITSLSYDNLPSPSASTTSSCNTARRVKFRENSLPSGTEGTERVRKDGRNLQSGAVAGSASKVFKEKPVDDAAGGVASSGEAAPQEGEVGTSASKYDGQITSALSEGIRGFEITSRWGILRFADPAREAEYFPSITSSLAMASMFAMLVTALTLLLLLCIEFQGIARGASAQGHYMLLIVCGVYVAVVPVLWGALYKSMVSCCTRVSVFLTGELSSACLSVACALSRPSFIAGDAVYLLFIMASTFITCASGMPWWRNTIYAVVMLTSNGAVLFALHDGVVKTSSLVAGGLVLLLVILFLRWQELAARHRHRDVCIVKLANEVEVREKDILQNALAAVIPAPLVSTAISMWSSRQRRDGDVIRVERGVVVLLYFRPHAINMNASMGTTISEAAPANTTAAAETLLKTFRCLTLTKVVGDTVLAAGPLSTDPIDLCGAVTEAIELVERAQGCTAAVTCGEFYAVIMCGVQQASFFLLGEAIQSAKSLLHEADPLTVVYSRAFYDIIDTRIAGGESEARATFDTDVPEIHIPQPEDRITA